MAKAFVKKGDEETLDSIAQRIITAESEAAAAEQLLVEHAAAEAEELTPSQARG